MTRQQHDGHRPFRHNNRKLRRARKGSVMILFALLLPAVLALCALAINIAYMQLTRTELKIATDAAARAAGRAMSIHQTTDTAMDYAQSTAALNRVAGRPLVVPREEAYITFGNSTRSGGGYGRYEFTRVDKDDVDAGTEYATSVRVFGEIETPALVRYLPRFDSFTPTAASIATQVDRDIALILDRSGSMGEYRDWDAFEDTLSDLRRQRRISRNEFNNATAYLYNRSYSNNVINQLSGDMKAYASTYQAWINNGPAPAGSRWAQLTDAVNKFLDVLETTDQQELVSVASFAGSATLDMRLELDYSLIRSLVANIRPYSSTAIGRGMETGMPALLEVGRARPFAAKTIVVMTDGMNNVSPNPEDVAEDIVSQYNVTIHTVTFSPGADQSAMQAVAAIGNGKHYHANTGNELVDIFEEIANNLPTILTE